MKLSEFMLADHQIKQKKLLEEAVLVAKKKSTGSMTFLFQMDELYVEARFDLETKAPQEYVISTSMRMLDAYLPEISIDSLLE